MTSMPESDELHARRAASFGAVAAEYDRLRPSAPPDAVDWLLPAGVTSVLDLAAGTGLLTRLLVGRVPSVTAVEPDAQMREVLQRNVSSVAVLDGRAEELPLPDASVDCVLVASAWHWVEPSVAVPEIARVLRDGGRLGVLWTTQDRTVPWVRALDVAAPRTRWVSKNRHRVELPEGSPFVEVAEEVFRFSRTMPVDDVVALMGTYSAALVASEADRAAGLAATREALREQESPEGTVVLPYRCDCWRATRLPR